MENRNKKQKNDTARRNTHQKAVILDLSGQTDTAI